MTESVTPQRIWLLTVLVGIAIIGVCGGLAIWGLSVASEVFDITHGCAGGS